MFVVVYDIIMSLTKIKIYYKLGKGDQKPYRLDL